MTAFRVNHRYRAMYGQERFDWAPGQVVDLSPAQAEWANHDSAGVLSLVEEERAAEPDSGLVDLEAVRAEVERRAAESAGSESDAESNDESDGPVVELEQEPAEADDDTESAEATTEPQTPAEVPAQPKRRGRPPRAR